MRILILGGTAFLSAEIARQAVAAGHDVTCLARGSAAVPPAGAVWLQADRTTGKPAYADASGDWDAVIDVTRDPEQARHALDVLALSAAHWTVVSSCSVYASHGTPGAGEDAALLQPLAPGTALSAENYGEAKSAIERHATTITGAKAHLCRAGLIGGPGDASDRYGYWPARFSRDNSQAVVPDVADSPTQVIDVRDLAAWILKAAGQQVSGALNAVGSVVPFGNYLDESIRLAGHGGRTLMVPEDWLVAQGVSYWAGPDSLPLWLPPHHEGFAARSNAAAIAAGLTLRPWRTATERRLVARFQAAPAATL